MNDTPAEVEKRMVNMLAQKTPLERLLMASSMFNCAKKLMIADIRRRKPAISEPELRSEMFLRLHGEDFSESEKAKILDHLRRKRQG
jgi:hypothetical protein